MDLDAIGQGDGKKTIGVVVAHILLGGEGQLGDVVEGLDVLGLHARLVELLLEELDVVVAALGGLLQALELDGLELIMGHMGDLVLVCHGPPLCCR